MPQADSRVRRQPPKSGVLKAVLFVFFGASLFTGLSIAQSDMNRTEAESRLQHIQIEIKQLQQGLEDSREEHKSEQSRLRELDLKTQDKNLEFRELEKQRQSQLVELSALEAKRDEYLSRLEQRHTQLAVQVRTSYRVGRQSRLKLVLNQDSPAQLGRMLAYYDYINRALADRISLLREALTTLDTMQQSIDRELSGIEEVQKEQRLVLDELERQREERQVLLAGLASQISGEESRLRELQRNRQDLETLISRLASALADIPADLGQHLGVASHKGRLPMPVNGPVKHAFGQSRTGGLRWQGWLIGAAAGSDVNAVAYGRIAFADWLRGYGLLIIIDHGEGFMTLYGHNESLLHEVGDWVERDEAISVVGAGAGNDQGLYFELRKNGKAVDPAVWLAR